MRLHLHLHLGQLADAFVQSELPNKYLCHKKETTTYRRR